MASVLTVQALFFADGGSWPGVQHFLISAFPLFYRLPVYLQKAGGRATDPGRILLGAMAAAILSLQMGRLGWCWKPGSRVFRSCPSPPSFS